MEKQKSENEMKAVDFMGRSFIKVPCIMMNNLLDINSYKRKKGLLHLSLFGLCYHTDGYVKVKNRRVLCARGEYVGTYRDLADLTGIGISSIYRIMHSLVKQRLVEVTAVEGGSRIRVYGYEEFTSKPVSESSPKGKTANAATCMAVAEARIGGRSMQLSADNRTHNITP